MGEKGRLVQCVYRDRNESLSSHLHLSIAAELSPSAFHSSTCLQLPFPHKFQGFLSAI